MVLLFIILVDETSFLTISYVLSWYISYFKMKTLGMSFRVIDYGFLKLL